MLWGEGPRPGTLWPLSRGCQRVGVPLRRAVAAIWLLTWGRPCALRVRPGAGCLPVSAVGVAEGPAGAQSDTTSDGLSSCMWLHTGADEDAGAAPL